MKVLIAVAVMLGFAVSHAGPDPTIKWPGRGEIVPCTFEVFGQTVGDWVGIQLRDVANDCTIGTWIAAPSHGFYECDVTICCDTYYHDHCGCSCGEIEITVIDAFGETKRVVWLNEMCDDCENQRRRVLQHTAEPPLAK